MAKKIRYDRLSNRQLKRYQRRQKTKIIFVSFVIMTLFVLGLVLGRCSVI